MSKINRAIAEFKYGDRVDRYRYRTRLRLNHRRYTIDEDTWLARHNQPLSQMRSPRALDGRADMLWRKFMRTPTPQQVDEWRIEPIDTGDEGHWFIAIRKK